jgi:hypothetical protein
MNNDIAEALLHMKYEVVVVNIVAICIAIILTYVFVRLKKSAELKEINNNFSTVITQQEELTKATELIKQSIEQKNIDYQIRLNAYYEKSISGINCIYIAIINLRESSKKLGISLTPENRCDFFNKVCEFQSIFDINKIWIPSDIFQHIEIVAKKIEARTTKFLIANKQQEQIHRMPQERIEQTTNEIENFYDYINKEIDFIFEELVEKISKKVSV